MTETTTLSNIHDEETQELIKRYLGRGITSMLESPATEPIPILSKGILVKESKACIYAKEKVGKSVFALQLGLCCASGIPFLDIPVKNAMNVLYLNFEVHPYMLEQRVLQIMERLGLKKVLRFKEVTLLGEDIPLLDTEAGFKEVVNILYVHKIEGFD